MTLTYPDFKRQQRDRFKAYLTGSLARCEWDIERTARTVEMKPAALRQFMQDYQIERTE